MKTTRIIYWITTGLFAAFMFFTAIPNVMSQPESVQFISTYLGYPAYFIPFIGIAKAIGSIAILIPSFRLLKEWAYAGLFFDLAAACYSIASVAGIKPDMIFLVLPLVVGAVSYIYSHKVQKHADGNAAQR
jgi:hypothetical protein